MQNEAMLKEFPVLLFSNRGEKHRFKSVEEALLYLSATHWYVEVTDLEAKRQTAYPVKTKFSLGSEWAYTGSIL